MSPQSGRRRGSGRFRWSLLFGALACAALVAAVGLGTVRFGEWTAFFLTNRPAPPADCVYTPEPEIIPAVSPDLADGSSWARVPENSPGRSG